MFLVYINNHENIVLKNMLFVDDITLDFVRHHMYSTNIRYDKNGFFKEEIMNTYKNEITPTKLILLHIVNMT